MEEGDRNASDDFVALTNTKLTHSLPSIRQRALESLHFKLKHNLLPMLAVTSNEDVLENVLLALDSETRTNIGEDDSKRSLIVAILTTIVRKSTKQELFVFQRTMRKIRGEGALRRIAMDCKLTNGKEWMSEEIEHYFKAKRRAMVMNVGRENYQENDTDEDEEYDVVRESFNAKEEEIRRRLKRYEDEEMRTSTRNEQTVNRIAEVPRMVKCVSSDGSFGRRLVSRRRQHSFNDEEKKNEYDILRKHLTQYERTLKTTTNVDVLLGVLRALRENILSDWGVQAFAFANPESGIVRAACDILVSSSNSRHSRNGAEDVDAGEEDFLNLDRSVVSLKREALLFLADVALGLKSALYENRSDSGSGSSNSYRANAEICDDDDVHFNYAASMRRREVIFSQSEHHTQGGDDDTRNKGGKSHYYYYSVHALPIAHAIAEAFIACARYPSLCGETCELFERCFLEYDVLELSDIDANTNGAHPSSIVRLKGYLRSWNVSGARSVSDFGANALCFITSEKLARFAKGLNVENSKKKFTSIDDIYDNADEEEEGSILRVDDALIESCVERLDQSDSHEDAHGLLDAMFIMRALGGSNCLLKSLASTRQTISGSWERFLLVKPKTMKDTALWSRMLRLLSGCLNSIYSSSSGTESEEKEHAVRFLAYSVAKVGAHACRRALLEMSKPFRGENEANENVDPNFVTVNTFEDSRPVWLKHPIAIERELERCGDANGIRRLSFQEVLRDVRDCLEALLRLSSNTSLNAVDVFAKSSELTNTLSSALKDLKGSVEYGTMVACCDSIYALAVMAKRTTMSKQKTVHTDELCESCLPDLLRVVERISTSIVHHLDRSRSSSIFDDACGGEALLESSLLAVIEVCKNASSPSIWSEKFDESFENTSNILLSLVARISSANSVASSKSPRCVALVFDFVAMLSAAFLDDSHATTANSEKAIASCQRTREIVFASAWFDCASLHAIDKRNASIARYRAAVCVAQILSSVAKDETSLFDDEAPSLDPGSNTNSGRVSMISLLSRRKLWITFARLLEEHVGTDALSARGISSAMVACARIDVVTAREAFSEFNMCLKNWLRPMNKAAAEGEVHTHRCATSANVSKLLGLFIVGEHLNAGDYESDNGLKARPNSPVFYALFDVLKSVQSRGLRAKSISHGELRAASSAALAIAAMLDGEYNNSSSANKVVWTHNILGDENENARGDLCETTCALLEMSLSSTSTITSSLQGLFALIATMFSCERSSRDALTFDPEDDEGEDDANEMLPKTPPLIEIENDDDVNAEANDTNEGACLPLGARLSRVLSRAFIPRIVNRGIDTNASQNVLYTTVAFAFQNVLAHCASAKFESLRSNTLEIVMKRLVSEDIDAQGIAMCLNVLQHASFSGPIFDEENDGDEEGNGSSTKLWEAAVMIKNAILRKYNGVLVFEKLFSLLFTPGRTTTALTLPKRIKTELRDGYLACVTNFILESDEFKRGICTATKNSGETSLFNRLVSFLFREKEKTSRLRDPLSFAEEKFIPSTTMARGVKLLSSLSTFSLTRAQLSRSIFIEKCCEMIARFSISGTSNAKNRSRVDLKIECDAAIDALCVLSGSDDDGAKLLLRSCKINIIGLLVDCYEYVDNIFDETVHTSDDQEEEMPSSYLLTKRKLLLLLHNLSFAGDVAKAHFCAKTKSLDILIDGIENSFDPQSILLCATTLLSLSRRGARVLASLRRGDRERRLRRCARVASDRRHVCESGPQVLHGEEEEKRSALLSKAFKRLGEILNALRVEEDDG
mgnify:FL=1